MFRKHWHGLTNINKIDRREKMFTISQLIKKMHIEPVVYDQKLYDRKFSNILCGTENAIVESNSIVIVDYSEYHAFMKGNRMIFCTLDKSKPEPKVADYTFFFGSLSKQELYEKCLDGYNKLQFVSEAKENIMRVILDSGSIQDTLKVSELYLGNPIILFDFCTNLLAISSVNELQDYDDEALKDFIDNRYTTYEVWSKYKISEVIDLVRNSERPFVLTSHFATKMKRLFMKVCIDDRMVAFFGVQGINREFSEEDVEICLHLSAVLSVQMKNDPSNFTVADIEKDGIFFDLLTGRISSKDALDDKLSSSRWQLAEQFQIMTIEPCKKMKRDITYFKTIQMYFTDIFPVFKTIVFNERIVVFINLYSTANLNKAMDTFRIQEICFSSGDNIGYIFDEFGITDICLEELRKFFLKNDLIAALSDKFSDVFDVNKFYKHTIQDLEIKKRLNIPECFVMHRDLFSYELLSSIRPDVDIMEFCIKEIFNVLKYEKTNNIELISVLEVYIKHNGNLTLTSEELYLHKNTIRYRLKIIERITGCLISRFGDMSRLMLSLKILRMKFPETFKSKSH